MKPSHARAIAFFVPVAFFGVWVSLSACGTSSSPAMLSTSNDAGRGADAGRRVNGDATVSETLDAEDSDRVNPADSSADDAGPRTPPAPRCTSAIDGGHGVLAPVVFNAQRSARPGDVVYLQGANFADAQVTLGGVGTVLTALGTYGSSFVSVQIPESAHEPLYLCVGNANGMSPPVLLDQAIPYNLDTTEIVPNGPFRLFGKNLLIGDLTPTVTINGAPALLNLAESTGTLLVGTAPPALVSGEAQVTVDNGTGGGPAPILQPALTVVVSGSTADPFDLNVAWGSLFAGIAGNTIDPTSDAHVTPQMIADDETDDTPGLQAAVDYASSIGGATVAIPAGTYRIGGRVMLSSGVVIRGAGKSQTILDYTDTTFPNYPIDVENRDRVGLADLTLSTTVGDQPILWEGNTHSFLARLALVEGTSSNWMFTSGNVDFAVENCDFMASALGVGGQGVQYAGFSSGLVLTDNTYSYVGGVALDLTGTEDSYVAGNTFVWDVSVQKATWIAGGSTPGDVPAVTHGLPLPNTKRLTVDSNIFQIANGPILASWDWNDGEAIYAEDGDVFRTAHVGTVTSATTTTLTDTAVTLTFTNDAEGSGPSALDGPLNYVVSILSGTGYGQLRHIAGYSGQTISLATPWDVVPDGTSVYLVVVPSWENVIIAHNKLTEWPRGTWSYILAAHDVDILDNSYTEGGGVYLRGQSGATTEPAYAQAGGLDTVVVMNVNVSGNVVSNTTGNWNSYFAALYDTLDPSPAGLGFVGVTFRGNTLVANNPNIDDDNSDLTAFEGYANFLHYEGNGPYVAPAGPVGLGTIFQGNSCTNCAYPFRTGTGDVASVYFDTKLVNSSAHPLVTQYFVPSGASGSQGDVIH